MLGLTPNCIWGMWTDRAGFSLDWYDLQHSSGRSGLELTWTLPTAKFRDADCFVLTLVVVVTNQQTKIADWPQAVVREPSRLKIHDQHVMADGGFHGEFHYGIVFEAVKAPIDFQKVVIRFPPPMKGFAGGIRIGTSFNMDAIV